MTPPNRYELWQLRLYVAGRTPTSQAAIRNLERICAQYLIGRYRIEVLDVNEVPERAREDQIVATPTLIRRAPLPVRRVLGDLSDLEKVLSGLDIPQA